MTHTDVMQVAIDATDEELAKLELAFAGALEIVRRRRASAPSIQPDPVADMTPEEVAADLGVTRSTVYNLCKRKHDPLPSFHLSAKTLRIPRVGLMEWKKRVAERRR